jgi:RNA polymerase sigma factor (sigma-70 family)
MTISLPFSPDAVRRLLAGRDWRLLDEVTTTEWEAFLADVAALLAIPNPKDASLNRAVTAAYGRVLYTACMADGTRRQGRAFTELGTWVYAWIHRRVADENDARDLTQEVLLTVFQERHQVDRPFGFLAWVIVIAHNRVRAYYRDQKKRPPDGTDDDRPSEFSIESPLPTIEVEAAEAELLTLVERCLERQAHTQRLIFIELLLRRRSFGEIAAMYNIKVKTLHRAWERLQARLRQCRPLIAHLMAHLPPSRRAAYVGW